MAKPVIDFTAKPKKVRKEFNDMADFINGFIPVVSLLRPIKSAPYTTLPFLGTYMLLTILGVDDAILGGVAATAIMSAGYINHKMRKGMPTAELYTWEEAYIRPHIGKDEKSSLEEIKDLSEKISKEFNVEAPDVSDKIPYLFMAGAYRRSTHTIHFPKKEVSKKTALHEIAHAVTWQLYKDQDTSKFDGHGPEFRGVLAKIYADHLGFNYNDLIQSMRFLGMDVKEYGKEETPMQTPPTINPNPQRRFALA